MRPSSTSSSTAAGSAFKTYTLPAAATATTTDTSSNNSSSSSSFTSLPASAVTVPLQPAAISSESTSDHDSKTSRNSSFLFDSRFSDLLAASKHKQQQTLSSESAAGQQQPQQQHEQPYASTTPSSSHRSAAAASPLPADVQLIEGARAEESTEEQTIATEAFHEFETIIKCGAVIPPNTEKVLTHAPTFFGHAVEVFTATIDAERRPLYKSSDVARRVQCASNKLAMYASRRTGKGSIYQATGFSGRTAATVPPLKLGTYFLTIEACEAFRKYCGRQPTSAKHQERDMRNERKHDTRKRARRRSVSSELDDDADDANEEKASAVQQPSRLRQRIEHGSNNSTTSSSSSTSHSRSRPSDTITHVHTLPSSTHSTLDDRNNNSSSTNLTSYTHNNNTLHNSNYNNQNIQHTINNHNRSHTRDGSRRSRVEPSTPTTLTSSSSSSSSSAAAAADSALSSDIDRSAAIPALLVSDSIASSFGIGVPFSSDNLSSLSYAGGSSSAAAFAYSPSLSLWPSLLSLHTSQLQPQLQPGLFSLPLPSTLAASLFPQSMSAFQSLQPVAAAAPFAHEAAAMLYGEGHAAADAAINSNSANINQQLLLLSGSNTADLLQPQQQLLLLQQLAVYRQQQSQFLQQQLLLHLQQQQQQQQQPFHLLSQLQALQQTQSQQQQQQQQVQPLSHQNLLQTQPFAAGSSAAVEKNDVSQTDHNGPEPPG